MRIDEFYRDFAPSLAPITEPRWRQFRFDLGDGRFFKVPRVIRHDGDMADWLVRKAPLDVYYTVGRFLSPERIGPRSEVFSDNLFLGADLVFDLDREPFSPANIESARVDAVRLESWLECAGIRVKYRAFSGSKGFHLVCDDPFVSRSDSPIQRERQAKARRKVIAQRVLEEGIQIDAKVTVDTRRILRLPGTINSKTGLQSRVLSAGELREPAERILNNCRRVDVSASRIREEMTGTLQVFRKTRGSDRWEVRSDPSHFFSSFLSSQVSGTLLHVPLIDFGRMAEDDVMACIRRLQSAYHLSDFFLFRGDSFFGLSLDALPARRVQKILKAAKARNERSFVRFAKSFARISPKVGPDMDAFEPAPAFVRRVPGLRPGAHPRSRAHGEFLKNCGIAIEVEPHGAGDPDFILSHALVQR